VTDRLEVLTFGCRLNAFESEVMRGLAAEAGLADAVIVNTCAVTAEAERQARQAIRKARRRRPGARIIVTGCAAQIDPEAYAALPEVDRVLGNREKLTAAAFGGSDEGRVRVADIMTARETAGHLIAGFQDRARAFVEVQQGCDHRCTFCVIPFGRGNSRSAPLGQVVEQARRLVASGYRELVLTGVDLTAWGGDLPGRPRLGQAVRRLLACVPELERLRLSSLDPVEIDDELLALLGDEPRLMPHLHLSIQAGDDLVLKRMKRRHLAADVLRLVDRARHRRPDVVFGADLIAGFPTETEAMFAATLGIVDQADLTWLHVFPYSARRGTPAARMPQVPMAERRARAARLREAGERRVEGFLARQIGREVRALVEQPGLGRTEHYAPVALDPAHLSGSVVRARVTGATEGRLTAITPTEIAA
jgi:threonylcarbamoyladenosine tRNA methylthiotransferase MtaB